MPRMPEPIADQLATLRKSQILDAATRVFAEKGFHRATIKDIARVAGIADGTVYIYFGNKTDLLIGILDRLNESAERESDMALSPEGDFREFVTGYLRHRISLIWPSAEVFRAVLPELLANPELRGLYFDRVVAPTLAVGEAFFATQAREGRIREVDVPLVVRAMAGMILGLLTMHLLGDREVAERWDALPEVLAGLLLDGLRPAGSDGASVSES